MTETSGPKQNKHQPEKIHDPQEKAMDSTAAVPSEAKPTAADTARAATLKGRKRTKTGCLSRPLHCVEGLMTLLTESSMSQTQDKVW